MVRGWYRRMSGRVAAAAVVGMMLTPVALPLALSQPAAAQAAPGNGNGNGPPTSNPGNGHGPPTSNPGQGHGHNTTTTACTYPFNNCATTTTTSPGQQPVIIIDVTVAVAGQTIEVTVCGYVPPGLVVKITFNGVVVAQVVIGNGNPATCTTHSVALGGPLLAAIGPVSHALVQAQTASGGGGGSTSFNVPSNTPPGSYLVCAEAPGEPTPCTKLNVASRGASVLGTTFSNNAPLVSSSNPNSFLAFSGMGLVRLLCLAGALMGLGWFLVRRSTPRRA